MNKIGNTAQPFHSWFSHRLKPSANVVTTDTSTWHPWQPPSDSEHVGALFVSTSQGLQDVSCKRPFRLWQTLMATRNPGLIVPTTNGWMVLKPTVNNGRNQLPTYQLVLIEGDFWLPSTGFFVRFFVETFICSEALASDLPSFWK